MALTKEQIEAFKNQIDRMTTIDLARFIRVAPPGHPCFCDGELNEYFVEVFNERGGVRREVLEIFEEKSLKGGRFSRG